MYSCTARCVTSNRSNRYSFFIPVPSVCDLQINIRESPDNCGVCITSASILRVSSSPQRLRSPPTRQPADGSIPVAFDPPAVERGEIQCAVYARFHARCARCFVQACRRIQPHIGAGDEHFGRPIVGLAGTQSSQNLSVRAISIMR